MKSLWATVGRFLTAEEVPRWFGLAIVLIYLVGLGSVSHFAVVQARRESASQVHQSSRYALGLLASRLSSLASSTPSDSGLVEVCQHELDEFCANAWARSARLIDANHRIIVSTNPGEIGRAVNPASPSAEGSPLAAGSAGALPGTVIRTSIRISRGDVGRQPAGPDPPKAPAGLAGEDTADLAATADRVLILEAVLGPVALGGMGLANQARALVVVLIVLGALFVTYRCLREQLRTPSRIADRLEAHRDRLEDELDALRIADSSDGVATAWNELIDLTQRLHQTVERSDADKELTQVLQRSGSGGLADALHAVPDGIVFITDEVRFEYVNTAGCRLFGWDPEEIGKLTLGQASATGVGEKVLDILRDAAHPDGSFSARTVELSMADDPGDDSSSYRVHLTPVQRAHTHGACIVVIRDVSQQVRADLAREEFITQVTHELRTPLTNIRAYTETLSSGMFDDPSVITECYNVITKETRRLSRLVEDILSISQLEVGTIELHMDTVDVKVLLSDGVRDVRGLADEKNIDLQLVLPAKMEPLQGDRDKLAVVINNLLGNAIKYTPADGNIIVGYQVAQDEAILTIKDNGIGIAAADLSRVFEKFQRADDPDVQKETGTGIGLYTAREIVRLHRGDIEVISEKGVGSTFLVRLPQKSTRSAALTKAEEA